MLCYFWGGACFGVRLTSRFPVPNRLAQKKKQSSKVLFQFTISYLLLMIIPFLTGIIAYSIALHNAEDQLARTNELALERAASELECTLTESDAFVLSLSRLNAVQELFDGNESPTSMLQEVISSLPEFHDTYKLVQRYYIYVPDKKLIIDNRNAYPHLKNYYDTTFRYGDLAAEQFEEKLLGGATPTLLPVTDNEYLQKNYRSIVYAQKLVMPNRKSGKVYFYIDEGAILKRMQVHFGPEISASAIRGPLGDYLLNTDPALAWAIPEDVGNRTGSVRQNTVGLLSFHYSSLINATFFVAVPMSYVSNQLSGIQTTMITGISTMLAIGLLLAAILFFQNRKPLAATINSLPDPQENDSYRGLNWLEYAVRNLTERHEQLKSEIQLQRMELQNAAVHRLINGGEKTEEGIEKLLEYVGIHLNGDWFRAVLVRTGTEETWNRSASPNDELRRANIYQVLSGFDPALVFLGLTSQNICALIDVGQDGEEHQTIYQALYQRLLESGENDVMISVGSTRRLLGALYLSFKEADQQMERAADGCWLLIDPDDGHHGYHFTVHDEQRLENLASSSGFEAVSEALDHLWKENFVRRNITGFDREILFYRMMDAAIQASGDENLMASELHLISEMSPADFFDMMRQKFKHICSDLQTKRDQSSNTLLDSILAYLGEQYTDCNTCLASVALHFCLTEKYLSAFFKEKSGINFSTYLENLRMDQAERLLQSQLTIEDISKQVGYNSAKSFSRAYYRRKGYTPSRAREK